MEGIKLEVDKMLCLKCQFPRHAIRRYFHNFVDIVIIISRQRTSFLPPPFSRAMPDLNLSEAAENERQIV